MRRYKVLFVLAALTALQASASDRDLILNLSQYRGQVVVIDFWASWCVPCRRSFPWLDAMQRQYADEGLVVIGVNLDRDDAEVDAFLREYPVEFRIVRDPQGALAKQFDVVAMPSSYVLNRDGKLIARHMGFKVKKQADYEHVIKTAIAGDRS